MDIKNLKNHILRFKEVPPGLLDLLRKSGLKTDIKRLALVGGCVRDEIISISQQSEGIIPKDIDILVEGSAIKLANYLFKELGENRISKFIIHENYQTAEITVDGIDIDLATARRENYLIPGGNPEVTPCSIEEDLSRRDFTINAIIFDIYSDSLFDPLGGISDIYSKELNLLHDKSILEDPTRIIRAARYSSRIRFNLSKKCLLQIKSSLKEWPWRSNNGEIIPLKAASLRVRLRMELDLLFKESKWLESIENLSTWGALVLLDDEIQKSNEWKEVLKSANSLNLDLLTALILIAKQPEALASRLELSSYSKRIISEVSDINTFICQINSQIDCKSWKPSRWCKEIESKNWQPISIAYATCLKIPSQRELSNWWRNWRLAKSPISAKQLIEQGWEEGIELGNELKRLRDEFLDL